MKKEAKQALEELEKELLKEDKYTPRFNRSNDFYKFIRKFRKKIEIAISKFKDIYRKIDPCALESVLRGIDETKIENAIKELVEYSEGKESILKLGKLPKKSKEPSKDDRPIIQKYRALLELNSDLLQRILEKRDRLIKKNKGLERICKLIPQRLRELIIVRDLYRGVYRELNLTGNNDKTFGKEGKHSEEIVPKIEFKAILGLLKKKGYLKTTADGYFWTKKTVDALGRKFLDEILENLEGEVTSNHGYELSDEQRDYELGDSYDSIVLESMIDAGARDSTFSSIKHDDLRVWKTKTKNPRKSIVIATDVSISMKGKKLWVAKKAALTLLELEKRSEENKIFLTAFCHKPYKLNPDELLNQEVLPGTNISGALKYSKEILSEAEGKKYVFLVSDCQPRGYDPIKGEIPEQITKTLEKLKATMDSYGTSNYKTTHTFYQASPEGLSKDDYDSYKNAVKAAMELKEEGIKLNVVNIYEGPDDVEIEFGKLLAKICEGNFFQTSPEDLDKVLVKEYLETN